MPAKSNKSARNLADKATIQMTQSLDGIESLSLAQMTALENPRSTEAALIQTRQFAESNWLVDALIWLRVSFLNYGLAMQTADKTKKKEFAEWQKANGAAVAGFIYQVWVNWVLYNNVVAFWRKAQRRTTEGLSTEPMILPVCDCTYANVLGKKVLKVRLKLSRKELEDAGFTPAEIERYSKNEITVEEGRGEFFRVIKLGLDDRSGFAMPRLRRVFKTLSQCDSMEVGESQLAFLGRTPLRQHKIGFEVKAAANAMKQSEFLYKEKRAKSIMKGFETAKGAKDVVTQFDHTISLESLVDPKYYDGDKWETIVNRVCFWGGPVAMMLIRTGINPTLLPLAQTEAKGEREIIGDYVRGVIQDAWNPPGGVTVTWGNKCFQDSRLAWDMVKTLMTQGPLSLTSSLQAADFNPETERENKDMEAKLPPEQMQPLWDSSHGLRPGEAPGRPPDTGGIPQTK